jgi:macrolide transport system ATP-binding/permease protein
MWNDFRFALRQLAAAKGFTITATLTLALGIGANTGIFTLIHALMLKSLPVNDPARIVQIGNGDNCCVLGLQGNFALYSYPLYKYLRDHTPGFEEMSAFQAGFGKAGVRRAGVDTSEPFVDQFVSGNYFTLFGLRPFAGRLLAPADDARGATPVAVMSFRAWQQHYAADPNVIGSTFVIAGSPFTIVGVAPPGFYGAILRPDPPDFWLPLAAEPAVYGQTALLDRSDSHWLYAFGRIRAGVQLSRVEAGMNVELRRWLDANVPASDPSRNQIDKQHIALVPGGGGVAMLQAYYRNDLTLLFGITGLVLLIACANLANLQLARGAARRAQTSIRVALGASRSRLIRQVLVECTILAVAGGLLGLLIASETAGLLLRLSLRSGAYVPIDTTPSLPILGFAFLLSVATGVAFGIAPAWSASRADPAAALHGAGRSASGRSSLPQRSLVVLQAALSLVLLAGAGLMVRTLHNLTDQQFGFRMEGSMVVNVNAAFGGYAPEKLASVYGEIDRRMRQIPGVTSAALALYSPMSGNNWQMGGTIEGRPQPRISPSWDRVSPSFFDTVGATILRGRAFDDRDTPAATHVAVVNQAFVDAYLPNEDPIGKRFGLGSYEHRADYTIVGVVNTIRFRDPRAPGRPMFFVPLLQMSPAEWDDKTKARSNIIGAVILRVQGNPPGLAPRIQSALGAIDPNLTMLNLFTTRQMLGQLLSHEQLIGVLAQIFGLLALVLASVGLYGITSYSVARRTAEIGLRTALGATRSQVVKLILAGALTQAAIGVAVGIPASLAAGRLLAGEVYGIKTSDPMILTAASILLALCAAIAAAIPALRASTVDPVTALRVDN